MLNRSAIKNFLRFAWEHSPFYHKLYLDRGIREHDPEQILSSSAPDVSSEHLRPGGGFTRFKPEQLEDSIAALFERQAACHPESIAVKDGLLHITYSELNRSANQVAHRLRDRQMDAARPVALLFHHQAAMI